MRCATPTTGRYVLGHLAGEDDTAGAYEVEVDHPEPTGRVQADAVSATGTSGLPFRVAWSGAHHYDVQWMERSRTAAGTWQSGPWRPWLRGTAASSAVFGADGAPVAVLPGRTYYLRVVAHDGLGGVGDPSAAVGVAVPVDDAAPEGRYAGVWEAAAGLRDRSAGTVHLSRQADSSWTAAVQGSDLALLADRGPQLGQVDVFVDGVRQACVDLGAPTAQRRAVVWRSGPLPGGVRGRTVRVVVVGTRGDRWWPSTGSSPAADRAAAARVRQTGRP